MIRVAIFCLLAAGAMSITGCGPASQPAGESSAPESEDGVADAVEFVDGAESRLARLGQRYERTTWVLQNFITVDTEKLAAQAAEEFTAAQVDIAGRAARFTGVDGLDFDTRRKLDMLRSGIVLPAPADPAKTAELAEISARLSSMFGRGSYCREAGDCLNLGELETIMASSREPSELLEAWTGWRTVSPPMKALFERQVELVNAGAADLGFDDLGSMWRSGYDMDPAEFPAVLDRLWEQVRPLYRELHCHVRARLADAYGTEAVPPEAPIPAHLLGNMWAQSWDNVYDLVAPPSGGAAPDLSAILQQRGFDALGMVRTGEAFFVSLGFEPLPATFWERSLFVKPRDREVVCHPFAYSIDAQETLGRAREMMACISRRVQGQGWSIWWCTARTTRGLNRMVSG